MFISLLNCWLAVDRMYDGVLAIVPGTIANLSHQLLHPDFAIPTAMPFSVMGFALGVACFASAMFAGALAPNLWAGIVIGWLLSTVLSGLISVVPALRPNSPFVLLRQMGQIPRRAGGCLRCICCWAISRWCWLRISPSGGTCGNRRTRR